MAAGAGRAVTVLCREAVYDIDNEARCCLLCMRVELGGGL